MRMLLIDSALSLCTAAVFADETALAVRSEPMFKGHQERLAGFVREAMAEAGTGFADLDRIGVTTGPGSFTGLRVGLAFAQGFGAALERPVVGISTLDALAASIAPDGVAPGAVAALIDARRGQVYARFWRGGVAEGPAEALSLEAATTRLTALGPGVTLVGSGAPLLAGAAPLGIVVDLPGPTPEALARLVAAAVPRLSPPEPQYLRAPDATPPTRLPGQPRIPVRP
ncbi:tRNA (adenosine(37)-N6)-threonylcarbamoyltransferase complex dimerization subunit type 1 TsaB [Brevundimonas sp.]|uniref:tRNA (adenosine(37)-N6)-threonylcarbamoyltransferase complex dimerization subunit type 1 TsaB n=1 Tax=Brevundimonas sp. TaxID=1871086 RepID=UPI003A8FBE6A